MSKTKQQVLAEATTIKNETVGGANTADRVGTAIYDVADNYVHSSDMPNMSNYQTTAAAAQETQRVDTALAAKATTSALNALTQTVAGKASASDLDKVEEMIQNKPVAYTDNIDVAGDPGVCCFVTLQTPGSVTVNEIFSGHYGYVKHFYIDCQADMSVQFLGGNISFTKKKFYHLVIMVDDHDNTHEFVTQCN